MTENDSPVAPAPVIVVAAALIDQSGCILVQRRPEGKSMAGLWEFPGGKVEPSEALREALARELQEELGIDVHPHYLVPFTFASEPLVNRELILLLFTCRKWSGNAVALHASEIRWVTPLELKELPMPPADAPFIGRLRALLT